MNFYDLLEYVITSCDRCFDIESIILGDFNINVSGSTDSSLVQHLKQFMLLFYLNQIISDPTRTTINSSTTIDLILTSEKHKLFNSVVIGIEQSDHSLIFCTRKVVKGAITKHNSVKVRSLKNYNPSVFKDKLFNVNWVSILAWESVDMACNMLKGYFLGVVDELAPLKEICIKKRTEPLMTGDILELITLRDKDFLRFKRSKNEFDFAEFNKLRNKALYLVNKAKTFF